MITLSTPPGPAASNRKRVCLGRYRKPQNLGRWRVQSVVSANDPKQPVGLNCPRVDSAARLCNVRQSETVDSVIACLRRLVDSNSYNEE